MNWAVEFQWDERNLGHGARHHVTPRLVREIAENDPKLFPDIDPDHSGTDFMIGPNEDGRFWTIVLASIAEDLWRPITGWPSTNTEVRRYQGE